MLCDKMEKERICPVMSAGTKNKPCEKSGCMWWHQNAGYCKAVGIDEK